VVAARLAPGAEQVLVPGILSLVVLHNSGVAFGLLGDLAPWLVVGLALTVLAALFYNKGAGSARGVEQLAYGLMIGGALGNVADRLRFGYVVDYIDVHIWPVFNVCDAFVVAGAALAAVASLVRKHGGDMGVRA
jgi:signal peptidase II